MGILKGIEQLLMLGRLSILAHLLVPSDFGLMAIALLVLATLETFSESGFQLALIQRKDDIQSHLDVAWTVIFFRGIILFIIIMLMAPVASSFFNATEAEIIVRVIGLSTIFKGASNIRVVYFDKELEFNKKFLYSISGTIADFGVSIISVMIFMNVWALVFGLLAGDLVRLVMGYIVYPVLPRFKFDSTKIVDLFTFGRWILISSIMVFIMNQGDKILIGRFVGIAALGIYQMAFRISIDYPKQLFKTIGQVTFPLYSKMQEDVARLRRSYLLILQIVLSLSIFITSLLIGLSREFVVLFLGSSWIETTPLIPLLAIAGTLKIFQETTGSVFNAVGKPRIATTWQTIRFIVFVTLLPILAFNWGLIGIAITILLSYLVSTLGRIFAIIKIIKCDSMTFLKIILIPTFNGIVTIIAVNTFGLFFLLTEIFNFFMVVAIVSLINLGLVLSLKKIGYDLFSIDTLLKIMR
jgi:O-antigen/teichoic acid export membrane protein